MIRQVTIWVVAFFLISPMLSTRLFAGLLGVSARAHGMADAFVSLADDASSTFDNPAGLTQLHRFHLASQYNQLASGLDDASRTNASYVGVIQPLPFKAQSVVGVSHQNFKGSSFFQERLLTLSYALQAGQWSWGANVKQWQRTYESNAYTSNALNDNGVATGTADPLFSKEGFKKETYAIDLGGLYRFGRGGKYSLGASVANVNRPDTSLANDGDKAPYLMRCGAAIRLAQQTISVETRRVNRLSSATDTDFAVGAEQRFPLFAGHTAAVRGGLAQGSRDFKQATLGFSIDFSGVQLDYSYALSLGEMANLSQQMVGLSIPFGRPYGTQVNTSNSFASRPIQEEDYASVVFRYYQRKAAGASAEERLQLLEHVLEKYSQNQINLEWVEKELVSL